MAKTRVGIDVGSNQLKMAVCAGGDVRRIIVADMPDNLVREGRIVSPEAMAEFLEEVAKKEKINTRACAVILPEAVAFTRTVSLPAMTVDNLKINLPYEFRDFITREKDKYFYDYAVIGQENDETGAPAQLELMAAVTLKETIAEYAMMCRRAGFKLEIAVPEELAYMNIIRAYEKRTSGGLEDKEYGILDIGHTATKLHIFRGVRHMATRLIESGTYLIDVAIAEQYNIDEHIARTYKHANSNNELYSETCVRVYESIVLEVTRAINFYRFNTPDSTLEDIYVCGGGARIEPLVTALTDELNMRMHGITEMLPESVRELGDARVCHMAIGVTMQ